MAALRPRYTMEEFARRGREIYERDILPKVPQEDYGKFAAIDIETGQYAIDEDEYEATERLWFEELPHRCATADPSLRSG